MPTRDDLKKLLYEQYKLKARVYALEDIVSLIQKYEKKVTRLHNDAKKNYNRLKKTPGTVASIKAMEKDEVLHSQIIEVLQLENEFLKRAIKACEDLKENKDAVSDMAKKIIEEENNNEENLVTTLNSDDSN